MERWKTVSEYRTLQLRDQRWERPGVGGVTGLEFTLIWNGVTDLWK